MFNPRKIAPRRGRFPWLPPLLPVPWPKKKKRDDWDPPPIVPYRPKQKKQKQKKLRIIYPSHGVSGTRMPGYRGPMRISPFALHGYQCRSEVGAAVEDPECVYAAFSPAPMRLTLEAAFAAIWRQVARKFGLRIKSFDDPISGTGDRFFMNLSYKATPNGAITNSGIPAALVGTTTNISFALACLDAIHFVYTSTLTYFELTELRFFRERVTTNTDPNIVIDSVHVDPKQCRLYFDSRMGAIIQNRTPAKTGENPELQNMLDVSNNPLHGKIYYGTGTTVSIQNETSGAGNVFITTSKNDGVGTALAGTANTPIGVNKPQPFSVYYSMKSHAPVRIEPGQIRKMVCTWKKSMTLKSLVYMYRDFLRNNSSSGAANSDVNIRTPIMMIGLERYLDSRQDEPPVRIAYETDLTLNCRAFIIDRQVVTPRII